MLSAMKCCTNQSPTWLRFFSCDSKYTTRSDAKLIPVELSEPLSPRWQSTLEASMFLPAMSPRAKIMVSWECFCILLWTVKPSEMNSHLSQCTGGWNFQWQQQVVGISHVQHDPIEEQISLSATWFPTAMLSFHRGSWLKHPMFRTELWIPVNLHLALATSYYACRSECFEWWNLHGHRELLVGDIKFLIEGSQCICILIPRALPTCSHFKNLMHFQVLRPVVSGCLWFMPQQCQKVKFGVM